MMFVKQRRVLIMMLVVLFTSVAAQAQLKFGLTAGMRFDRLKEVKKTGSSILGDDYNMNGYYVGLKLDLNTPVGFGVDLGVNFCNRNINDDNEWGMEVPINLKYNINILPVVKPYLLAGVGCYANFDDIHYYVDSYGSESWIERMEYSLNLGFGVTLVNHIQVGLTYQLPIGTYYYYYDDFDTGSYGKRASNWVASVAYLF